ncbi:hypothetical protein WR25_23398 [Diploscapter pachys]|uniref:Uncharacterized protein n=1 Tax=Diploscapter pachys TaxID=2018661 RepID=A0A2A2M1Q3_9BILA|nr:hypothetical protein WR25_23398 [Diploscapter pachys]
MPIQTYPVLTKTEIVTVRPGWPGRAGVHQSVIASFSCASRTYSDSGRTAWKYRSRCNGSLRGPTMPARSDSLTVPSEGMPMPRSIRP